MACRKPWHAKLALSAKQAQEECLFLGLLSFYAVSDYPASPGKLVGNALERHVANSHNTAPGSKQSTITCLGCGAKGCNAELNHDVTCPAGIALDKVTDGDRATIFAS